MKTTNDLVARIIGRYIPESEAPATIPQRGLWEWLRTCPEVQEACRNQPEALNPNKLTVVESNDSRAVLAVPTMITDHESKTAMQYDVEFEVRAGEKVTVTRRAGG